LRKTVVIGIHNEEKYLPYCLGSLWNAPVDEFIFVLDRCTDRSEEIVKAFTKYHLNSKIIHKTKKSWVQPVIEVFDEGAKHATGDFVFNVPADAAMDLKVFDEKNLRGKPLMFRYYNYNLYGSKISYAYEKILLRIYDRLGIPSWQCSMEALPREQSIRGKLPPEDVTGFQKVPLLVLKNIMVESEKKYFCVQDTKVLHLRPGLSKEEQLLRGIARYVLKYSPLKVLVHSLLYMKLYVLIGYIQARNGSYGNLDKIMEKARNYTMKSQLEAC
jgi:glycosyltransferase involved in cell wall biosynthesis